MIIYKKTHTSIGRTHTHMHAPIHITKKILVHIYINYLIEIEKLGDDLHILSLNIQNNELKNSEFFSN
jgi:hypothetical protein